MRRDIKLIMSIFYLMICLAGTAWTFSFFEEGEKLFMENRLPEAAEMLEAAVGEDPENEKSYLYLSIIYEGLGEYQKAVSILDEGLKYSSELSAAMYLNKGNSQFALGQYSEAVASYSSAIQNKNGFSEAYLNRANASVKNGTLMQAINDYTLYLKLKPSTPQKPNIEKAIELLKLKLAEEERRKREEEKRRLEEERQRQAEEQRRQEEARIKAEEERKRLEEEKQRQEEERRRQEALLQDILQSLNNAEDNSNDLTADSEDIEEFDLELELED